jgi:hypothetical protein
LAKWFDAPEQVFLDFYEELSSDQEFLARVSRTLELNMDFRENVPGLFLRAPFQTVDWFGFERIALYCITRWLKPINVLETGVFYGGNTVFVLLAILKNKVGTLYSVDYPQSEMDNNALVARHPWVGDSESYDSRISPGFIIPEYLRINWNLTIGDSIDYLEQFGNDIDLFIHDSEHTMSHVSAELNLVWPRMAAHGVALVDDIDWSNGFYKFIVEQQLFPLLLTDNGKDDLRVRTGLFRRNHPFNQANQVTK